MPDRDIAVTFQRWIWMRAVFHHGYWLVTSLYLVTEADLSAFQLVFLGTAQGITALVFEVPTGVLADTISRKWSLVLAHLVMSVGMIATGLHASFPALVMTQMLWGLGWTFSSGAEVAWLTDELGRPDRVASVLTASARWGQVGAACGIVGFGSLAWATSLSTAIVGSGLAMMVLGLVVAVRFSEHGFTPTRGHRWHASLAIARRGVALARRDREIVLVFVATLLLNGAEEGFGRLYPRHLLELGLAEKAQPIVWLTALGLATLGVAALALRLVEAHIDDPDAAPRAYAVACIVGAFGLLVLARAIDDVIGMAGVLVVAGMAWPVTRTVGVIWVNRRTTSDVRATVQSLLSQAEYAGEISFGLALGILAQATTIGAAMLGACALVGCAAVVAIWSRAGRARGVRLADE
ncbi:MAG: MFS transporter [Chloroflexi bacterium]|nr:MFS transporter [Chloroflexota bacterium]